MNWALCVFLKCRVRAWKIKKEKCSCVTVNTTQGTHQRNVAVPVCWELYRRSSEMMF